MELKRVVVTGIGAVTPLANTAPETWKAMLQGESGGGEITLFDSTSFKTTIACEVKNFKAENYMDRKEERKMDRFSHFAMASAEEAIKDSGLLEWKDLNRDEVGVIISSGIGGLGSLEKELDTWFTNREKGPRFSPFFVPRMISNMAAGHISIRYGFKGPSYAPVAACASSSFAIIEAFNTIRLGITSTILAGGAEACITESSIGGFNAMHALSVRNDSPKTASRPFSKSRDGFVMGEGAGCLLLEEREQALRRGAKIYAEVVGGGMSSDAYHITAPHADGLGAMLVMQRALKDAGLKPEDIDYINVHGTSTPLGDRSELKAIQTLWGEEAKKLNISSTKSMTGHLIGAAGAVEAIASILAIRDDIIPPTINFTQGDEDEEIDYSLNFTFNQPQKRQVRAAISNTFGFGGQNASILFKKVK